MPGLNPADEAAIAASLDRLARLSGGILCLAVSGGSDSMALAGLAAGWARRSGAQVVALCVDHGLQQGSADVARQTCARLANLGLAAHVLTWERQGPLVSGVQNRARAARHRLLARAARDLGSRIVVMAHTEDDLAETVLFRMTRGTGPLGLAGMEPLCVSPQWPLADGVLVARPLLGIRRAALRHWLTARTIGWHDDPANQNHSFARVRMRAALARTSHQGTHDRLVRIAADGLRLKTALRDWLLEWLAAHGQCDGPSLRLDRTWQDLPPALAEHVLGTAVAAVAGQAGSIRHDKISALLPRLAAGRATLAGTLLIPDNAGLLIGPAPPRKRPCGEAGAALHLPLHVRIAHLAGDCNAILSPSKPEITMDTEPCVLQTEAHGFVRHQRGMVSAGRYPIL